MAESRFIKPRRIVRVQTLIDGSYIHLDDLDDYLAQAIGNLEANLGTEHPEVEGAVTILKEIRTQVSLTRMEVDLDG